MMLAQPALLKPADRRGFGFGVMLPIKSVLDWTPGRAGREIEGAISTEQIKLGQFMFELKQFMSSRLFKNVLYPHVC